MGTAEGAVAGDLPAGYDLEATGGCDAETDSCSCGREAASMNITIQVPGVLRGCCDGASKLFVSAHDVRTALAQLEHRHPPLYRSVCNETGAVRRHVNLFVNTANIRDGGGLDTALAPGDVLFIMPAVSGG